jgi:hypothetical protein
VWQIAPNSRQHHALEVDIHFTWIVKMHLRCRSPVQTLRLARRRSSRRPKGLLGPGEYVATYLVAQCLRPCRRPRGFLRAEGSSWNTALSIADVIRKLRWSHWRLLESGKEAALMLCRWIKVKQLILWQLVPPGQTFRHRRTYIRTSIRCVCVKTGQAILCTTGVSHRDATTEPTEPAEILP